MKSRTILFAASIFILSMSCSDKHLIKENEELKSLLELKEIEIQKLNYRIDSSLMVALLSIHRAEEEAVRAEHYRHEMEKMKK